MVENTALRMSAFVDCASQSIVLRVPYELAVKMLTNCPDCADKEELMKRIDVASRRSPILSKMLEEPT